MEIRPMPTLTVSKNQRKRRPLQKAEVLTSTPVKEEQRHKLKKKKLKFNLDNKPSTSTGKKNKSGIKEEEFHRKGAQIFLSSV